MLNQKRNQTGKSYLSWLPFASALLFFAMATASLSAAANSTDFLPLDLSGFYTAKSDTLIPTGKQTFNGVPFNIDGRIELTGMNSARNGEFLPPELTGIPVNGKFGQLHLLLGARHGQKDGTPLANVLLHYKNGDLRALRLAYGLHARNAFTTNELSSAKLADPNTSIAWEKKSGTNELSLRLYHAILSNPLPEEVISTIDFVSLFSPATPIIFSVTLDKGQTPLVALPRSKVVQRAFQFDDLTYRCPISLHVTDASGKPLPEASATMTLQDDSKGYFFGRYRSGEGGVIQLSYPPQEAVDLSLRVTSPGLVPAILTLPQLKNPGKLDVVLQRGIPIGGVVVNTSGAPVSNAGVIPFLLRSTGSNQYTRTDLDTVQSGRDGTWSSAALAETVTNLSFEVVHPDYKRASIASWPAEELRSSKATATLQPHLLIIGKVLNEQGSPLAKATVILDLGSSNHTWQYTDANGQFKFAVPDPTNNSAGLIAFATGLAPLYRSVSLKATPEPVELRLDPGQRFAMRLTDQESQPVVKAKVTLMSWRGSKAMQWATETDKSGYFAWDHAPAGLVTFHFEKAGHQPFSHSTTLPSSGETTLTFSRRVSIAGRVLDAESQKPIDQFRARIRYKYQNGSGSTSTTGRKGSFSYSIGGSKYDEATVIVEARGYQPVSATMRPDTSGSFSNLFLLKKAIPSPGFVLAPDGTPAVGAEVVLLDKNASAYMEESGKFRRGYSDYEVALSDAKGRFELTPKLEPDFVVAAHRTLGFGQMPASNLLSGVKLQLKPWGHVKGVLKVGEKIEPDYFVAVHSANSWSPGPDESRQTVYTYIKMKPQADGTFYFSAVPPGPRTVNLRYVSPEQRDYGPTRLSHSVPIEVKPGATNDVIIGGTGRTVTGKLECTGSSAQLVDWRLYAQTLRPTYKPDSTLRPRILAPNATLADRQRAMEEYQKALNEANRRQQLQYNISYVLVCDADGSFRIPNLPAGDYSLSVTAVVPTGSGGYNYIGNLSQTVTVPEGNTPFDLGKIVVKSNQ